MMGGDIGDKDLENNILNGNHEKLNSTRIDAVMNFSAFTYVDERVKDPMIYLQNNVKKQH